MRIVNVIASISLISIVISCRNQQEDVRGVVLTHMDTTVKPTDDFFNYANGGWLKTAQIPPTEDGWGTLDELGLKNLENQHLILQEIVAKTNQPNSIEQKVADLYRLGMDSVKLNQEGIKPLQPVLQRIASIQDVKTLIAVVAYLHRIGCNPLWGSAVGQDIKNSNQYTFYIAQSGLGMPDRDYYTKTDSASQKIQQAYQNHLQKMLLFLGDDTLKAKKNAEYIYAIEKKLAAASMTRVERRNQEALYNKMTIQQLSIAAPVVDWDKYLSIVGVPQVKEVIVMQPLFIKEANRLLQSVPIEQWKVYLRWTVINAASYMLSDEIMQQDFEFYDKALAGKKEMPARWRRCLRVINENIGEGLGQLYVQRYFNVEAKQKINELVDNITAAFEERIKQLDWMSDSTKVQALAKLKTIGRKLGYPDKWQDYSTLVVKTDSYIENVWRANEFEHQKNVEKWGKPIDKEEWHALPQIVNAHYSQLLNEIVFPAGILQPPCFDPQADDASNYGAIGMIIGHELTHGFDDKGSKFDLHGNMRNWWGQDDRKKFDEKTQILVDQYNQFVAIDTLHVNGKQTLGENIADFGGITIAYHAFKRTLKNKKETEKIQGFTPEQRFFLSYAQVWCQKNTEELIKLLLTVDVHSPVKARINIPLSNMPEFYDAFGVKPGDKMYRDEKNRAKIW